MNAMTQAFSTLPVAELVRFREEQSVDAPTVANDTLPNVSPLFDRLYDLDQRAGYFAMNGFTTSLGYSVLNAHIWQFRRSANAKTEESVNVFNEDFAAEYERLSTRGNVVEQGFDQLPDFDFKTMTGVYLGMLYRCNADQLAKNFPPKTPTSIIGELTTKREDPAVTAMWLSYNEKLIAHSPAAASIAEAQVTQAARNKVREDNEGKAAKDAIVLELQSTKPENLNEHLWATLPVWVQYKFIFGIHKQACAAIAREQLLRESDFDKMDALIALASELQLELEAAARTTEVKMATNMGRLDNHQLVTTKRVVESA